jgi:O-antigen/teichoic acid export membrane protein
MNQGKNYLQAVWLGISSLSSILLSILSAAILSRYFNKIEYGTYKQILYVYSTLVVFFTAGLPNIFAYFLPKYSINEGKRIVGHITKILGILGVFFSIFLYVFAPQISTLLNNKDLIQGLRIFSPVPIFLLPTLGIEGIFATYKKTQYLIFFNILTKLFTLACVVLPIVLIQNNYIYAIYGWLGSSIFTFIIAIYFKYLPFKGINGIGSSLKTIEVLKYSLPIVIATIWGMAIKAADQFYISRYFGPEVYAEYSNGFMEIPFVGIITSTAATILMPEFSRIFSTDFDMNKLCLLFKSAVLNSSSIIYPIVIFFFFNSDFLMTLLYSNAYMKSGVYFKINLILNFFNVIIFSPLLFALGKTTFYSFLHLGAALLSWILGYIIIINFETPISIAILSVSINILMVLAALVYSAHVLKVKVSFLIPILPLIKILFHSGTIGLLVNLLISKLVVTSFENVLFNLVSYALIVLISAPLFKIDYLVLVRPIFAKFKI